LIDIIYFLLQSDGETTSERGKNAPLARARKDTGGSLGEKVRG
jgi:hypothetical protein